jgi:nucleoside-diphosphate-sugar epimerase
MSKVVTKISVFGCGWSGLKIGGSLVRRGYTVKGSTTSMIKLATIAMEGVLPFHAVAGFDLAVNRDHDFFNADVMVITLPPPRLAGVADFHLHAHRHIAKRLMRSAVKRVVLLSSTSVYPENNQVVSEDDAQAIVSSHSGVAMLDIERCYASVASFETIVLRLGGLIGPGRHPGRFMRSEIIKNSEAPVNVVHLDDVVSAVVHAIEKPLDPGAYNVVSPDSVTRCAFYTAARAALDGSNVECDRQLEGWKRVSADKLMASGYRFVHPNPMSWLITPSVT